MSGALSDGMSCSELIEVVTEYLEGTMPAPDRARFEAHIDKCPDCTDYLERTRKTIALLGQLREGSVDPHVRDRLLIAFRGWAARG